MISAPKYDERDARNIAAEVRDLLALAGWPDDDRKQGFEEALIRIFARFSELVIHRLNQAPAKNLLAFLDLQGVSQLPMQAARVPLTFYMAPGGLNCARVPAGAQIAAPPGPGQQKPIMFETERELIVTPARLDSLFFKFSAQDRYKDLGSALLLPSEAVPGANAVAGSPPVALGIPHVFHIAVPWPPSRPPLDQLRIRIALEPLEGSLDSRVVQWEIPVIDDPLPVTAMAVKPAPAPVSAAQTAISLVPAEDGTKSLTQNGDVVFFKPPGSAPVAIDGVAGNWLSCRLLTPISRSVQPVDGMVRASQLPAIKQISCEMELTRQALTLDQAFYNAQKLDITKDFFPFGERPKFGDVFYLANREAFSDPDAQLTLHVELTNPAARGEDDNPAASESKNVQLNWEFWNGGAWTKMGRARLLKMEGDPLDSGLVDGTNSFWNSGDVQFKFSSPPQETSVNGQKNYWIRVRIVSGNYGEDAHLEKGPSPSGLVTVPANLSPPSVKSIKVDYEVKKEAPPAAVLTHNDFTFVGVDPQAGFKPFVPAVDDASSILFGFVVDSPLETKLPPDSAKPALVAAGHAMFPNQTVTAYVVAGQVAVAKSGEPYENSAVVDWEYWNGSAWRNLPVRDETQGLRRNGLIQFLPPVDFATKNEFARTRYWLRMCPNAGDSEAAIHHVYLNTMTALQGLTVANDILGSSTGKVSQRFQTIQPMVLPGQKLEVREPTLPPLRERELIQANEGGDAIMPIKDPVTKTDQFWVTWQEVANFYGSSARDRHYVLNHVTGDVTFGDGTFGLIPPALPGNIRMTSYRGGGGVAGNQPSQTVTKLSTAIPYMQKVINWVPANGGTDPEENASLLERGTHGVRHGGRAVTFEDFEDLAMLASRDVARAKCVPLYDLSQSREAKQKRPGVVSIIVLPASTDPRPKPNADLLDRVRAFLDAWRLPTLETIMVGPEYVRVNVDAEVAVSDPGDASDAEIATRQMLDEYLHPVSGGPDGAGWEFGRLPQKFDLSVRIERLPGVSHVREINVSVIPERPGIEKTGHFLVCRGDCKIAMTVEEQRAVEFA